MQNVRWINGWTPYNWYVNPELLDNVINQQPFSVLTDLMGVMEHIITEGEMKSAECSLPARSFQLDETLVKCTPKIHSEEAYQSEIKYRNAQCKFR